MKQMKTKKDKVALAILTLSVSLMLVGCGKSDPLSAIPAQPMYSQGDPCPPGSFRFANQYYCSSGDFDTACRFSSTDTTRGTPTTLANGTKVCRWDVPKRAGQWYDYGSFWGTIGQLTPSRPANMSAGSFGYFTIFPNDVVTYSASGSGDYYTCNGTKYDFDGTKQTDSVFRQTEGVQAGWVISNSTNVFPIANGAAVQIPANATPGYLRYGINENCTSSNLDFDGGTFTVTHCEDAAGRTHSCI
jgi:hypothetical protein